MSFKVDSLVQMYPPSLRDVELSRYQRDNSRQGAVLTASCNCWNYMS